MVNTAKSKTWAEAALEKQIEHLKREIKDSFLPADTQGRTALKSISVDLDPELQDCADEDDEDGSVHIHHPLYISSNHTEDWNHYANCWLKLKRLEVERAVQKKNWARVIYLHAKPYQAQAFAAYMHNFDNKTYWSLLVDVYTHIEFNYYDLDLWRELLSSTRPGKEHMMTVEERGYLASLPEIITVFRGYKKRSNKRGMSWSLSKSKATFFARRFNGDADWAVTKKLVKKSQIIAYKNCKEEEEIILHPDALWPNAARAK